MAAPLDGTLYDERRAWRFHQQTVFGGLSLKKLPVQIVLSNDASSLPDSANSDTDAKKHCVVGQQIFDRGHLVENSMALSGERIAQIFGGFSGGQGGAVNDFGIYDSDWSGGSGEDGPDAAFAAPPSSNSPGGGNANNNAGGAAAPAAAEAGNAGTDDDNNRTTMIVHTSRCSAQQMISLLWPKVLICTGLIIAQVIFVFLVLTNPSFLPIDLPNSLQFWLYIVLLTIHVIFGFSCQYATTSGAGRFRRIMNAAGGRSSNSARGASLNLNIGSPGSQQMLSQPMIENDYNSSPTSPSNPNSNTFNPSSDVNSDGTFSKRMCTRLSHLWGGLRMRFQLGWHIVFRGVVDTTPGVLGRRMSAGVTNANNTTDANADANNPEQIQNPDQIQTTTESEAGAGGERSDSSGPMTSQYAQNEFAQMQERRNPGGDAITREPTSPSRARGSTRRRESAVGLGENDGENQNNPASGNDNANNNVNSPRRGNGQHLYQVGLAEFGLRTYIALLTAHFLLVLAFAIQNAIDFFIILISAVLLWQCEQMTEILSAHVFLIRKN